MLFFPMHLKCCTCLLAPTMQFFAAIVLPLFNSFVGALPSVEPLLDQVKANHAMWVREAELAAGTGSSDA